jgi:hypothetical protein
MSDTATNNTEPVDPQAMRARLRASVAKVKSEEKRLEAVEAGLAKAREQQWSVRSRLQQADAALERLLAEAPQRAAYAFLNDSDEPDPLAAAQADHRNTQVELDRLESIESALSEEVARIQAGLRQLYAKTWQNMADFVVTSPQYRELVNSHTAAWQRLRTVKQALRIVGHALRGYAPQQVMDEPNRSETTEVRIGYPVDDSFVESWRTALEELSRNADAELPSTNGATPPPDGAAIARFGRPNGNHLFRAK